MSRLHIHTMCFSTWLIGLLMLFTLTSCRNNVNQSSNAILPFKVDGASDARIIDLQRQLNQRGIRVITIGQDYLVSIPAKMLFYSQAPRLTWDAYAILNDVACYLRQFRQVAINVTAYSGKCQSAERDQALTLARARAVGNYLQTQNIDARFIFTQGLGSNKPIVGYTECGDQSLNARVEITFRNAVK